MSTNKIGHVVSSAPNSILVEIGDLKTFEENKDRLQIGRYLKIEEGNNNSVIAVINNLKGCNSFENGEVQWTFLIDCQAVGTLSNNELFERGSILLPVPTEPVYPVDDETFAKIFTSNDEFSFPFGVISFNKSQPFHINGDKFLGKHIAVVGSTGSGKSCTVAKILHGAVGIEKHQNKNIESQNNSHIVIFDIHSEYNAAFSLEEEQSFTLNALDVESLKLPYWLMNSEELESMFIESNELNSHNQVSQFKHAVIKNKERHNPDIREMTYDTPVYFSIQEVYNYIVNMNREVIGRIEGENLPKLADGTLVTNREECYFTNVYDFVPLSQGRAIEQLRGLLMEISIDSYRD